MILAHAVAERNINAAAALEIASLAPNESKLSLASSLAIVKNVVVNKNMISFEKSVGAVIFRKSDGAVMYLLLHYPSGHWDFSKGHMEKGKQMKKL